MRLVERTESFIERTGIPFSYLVVLYEKANHLPCIGDDAKNYADEVNGWSYPVLADKYQMIIDATPWTGSPLPGKCVLSPDMVLQACTTGEGDDAELFDIIEAHYLANNP